MNPHDGRFRQGVSHPPGFPGPMLQPPPPARSQTGFIVDPSQGLGGRSDFQTNFPPPMDLDNIQLDSPQFTLPLAYQQPQPLPQPSQHHPPQGAPVDPSSDAFPAAQQSENMSGVGAGPLPTAFGAPTSNNGSTLTEFTKRRNWSQRVLDEIRDMLYVLSPDGQISFVTQSCKSLTGFERAELEGKYIFDFIPNDDRAFFLREFNESIASGNVMRFFHKFRKADDTYAIFESNGHPHLSEAPAAPFAHSALARACSGFFMMSRPYPTKNAALLDSFLEHKIESERLKKKIADLKREEQDDNEAQERQWVARPEGQGSMTTSETQRTDGRTEDGSMSNIAAAYNGMPPPAKPDMSHSALTRQNLDEALAASKPDSINDKMARYEGATHIDSIEMMTGLRYRDGERSQGISTGDTSPALIRGDAGIAISVDKDNRNNGDKKKKAKVADEYVCTDCGTLDSPEWRKGPNGPKTLCNACGLRWAKKEKKRASVTATGPGQQTPSLPMQSSTGS